MTLGMAAGGLIIAGTSAKCGKTVVTAGLCANLKDEGYPSVAIKPVEFGPSISLSKGQDQTFINRVAPPRLLWDTLTPETPEQTSLQHWQCVLDWCRRSPNPVILEMPGSVATPLRLDATRVMDCVDLAHELDLPILLVTRKCDNLIAEMAPALTYLKYRRARLIGWVAVETRPIAFMSTHQAHAMYLTHHYQVPHWGDIDYDPNISVELLQCSSVSQQVGLGIDLLPLLQGLGLGVR